MKRKVKFISVPMFYSVKSMFFNPKIRDFIRLSKFLEVYNDLLFSIW